MIGLKWDLLAHDKASPAFGRLAGVIDKAAVSQERFSSAQLEADRVANRLKIAELQVAVATERHATASASASTSVSRQATAEIGLIRANQGLAEAQAASAAAAMRSSRAHSVAGKAATAGAAINKKLTLPVVALAAVSVNEAAKYQKSMTLIGTITDQTSQQMASTSKGLLTVAKDTGSGLHELGEGLYTVEKGGYRGAKALAITKAAAQGAKAENTDLATTTNALTSVMASYGDKLSDPVAAMNMMIKASGLSKTTMQDFAGSLSNVVPVASSLGIGFDQVGGAIATMTQHGESAQHATDNLRNLITNLAGQNNVASQSLQQLGVNTVDLSRNLGKRGLTGSLDIVLAAINKHGKDGQIVTSAFKEAATATASVKTELAGMPKALQANSVAFDKGKMSYKDYLAYAKSLGGQQYVMARQFLGTENTAKGFNNQLKSGNSNVRTLASTLQKSLGGVTGMNVALQLSGESADRFHTYVDEIGKSAKATKGDVLGWGNTQGTLAVKLDKAKASLQVMAVELGTALIPAVSKIVDWIGKAVSWFDKLSGTDKKVLLWSIGIIAALGPVLSIGGRLATVGGGIGRFVSGASSSLATLAGRSESSASRIARSMRTATGALAGAGLGYAVGQVAGNTEGKKGLVYGALGGAATGALAGAAIGGAPGALIGGAAGAVAGVIGAYNRQGDAAKHAGDAAKAALQEQKAAAEDLMGVLENVGGAYTEQYKQTIAHKLAASGSLGIAAKAGIKQSDVLQSVVGTKGSTGQAQMRVAIENAQASGKISWAQGKKLLDQLQLLQPAAAAAERQVQDETKALGKNLLVSGELGVSKAKLVTAFANTGTALGNETAAGARNNEIVRENIAAINANAASQLKHGSSVTAVADSYQHQINSLSANMRALGFNRTEVTDLIQTYGKVPKSVATDLLKRGILPEDIAVIVRKYAEIPASKTTTVTASDKASPVLNGIVSEMQQINDKTVTVTVQRRNGHAVSRQAGRGPIAKADGGHVRGPGTGTSDSIAAWLSNGEFVTREAMTRKHRGLLEAINNDKIPTFADGGVVKSGKGWTYDGHYYATKAGALNEERRTEYAKTHHSSKQRQTVVKDFGTYQRAIGRFDVDATASAYRSLREDAKAAGASKAALDKLAKSETAIISKLRNRATITDQVSKAQDRLNDLQSKAADLRSSVRSAFTGTFDITASSPQMFNDVAGGGTPDSILATVTAAADKADAFKLLLTTLGNGGLNATLLSQLAQAGPTAAAFNAAKALSVATPASLGQINAQYNRLDNLGDQAGALTANAMFGSQIAVANALLNGYSPKKNPEMAAAVQALANDVLGAGKQTGAGLVSGLLSQKKAAGDAGTALGNAVQASLKKSLKIKSPSRVTHELGVHTGTGFALGLMASVPDVAAASTALGSAAVPSPAPTGSGGWGGGDYHDNRSYEFTVNEADGGMDTVNKLMRRMAVSGP